MSDLMDIDNLIRNILNGDTESYGAIVREYTQMVACMVGRYARNEMDREDLAQEVFIRAYKALPKYRSEGSFEGWLRKIAVHTCLDWLRKQKHRTTVSLSERDENGEKPEINDKISSSEALEILQRAMESLSPEEHHVIVLKELEGKSINEISGTTGWSESNVKVRAHRARSKLKEILMRQGVLR